MLLEITLYHERYIYMYYYCERPLYIMKSILTPETSHLKHENCIIFLQMISILLLVKDHLPFKTTVRGIVIKGSHYNGDTMTNYSMFRTKSRLFCLGLNVIRRLISHRDRRFMGRSILCIWLRIAMLLLSVTDSITCISLHFDGLVQERRNSIANALELGLSCTNPSVYGCQMNRHLYCMTRRSCRFESLQYW